MRKFIPVIAICFSCSQADFRNQSQIQGGDALASVDKDNSQAAPSSSNQAPSSKISNDTPVAETSESVTIPSRISGASLFCDYQFAPTSVSADLACRFRDQVGNTVAADPAKVDISISDSDLPNVTRTIRKTTTANADIFAYIEISATDGNIPAVIALTEIKVANIGDGDVVADSIYILADITAATVDLPSVSSLTATAAKGKISLTWNGSGVPAGYLIVRSTAAITWQPSNKTSYANGSVDTNQDVIYQGSATKFDDTNVTDQEIYHYKSYAYDAQKNYSAASPEAQAQYLAAIPCGGAGDGCYDSAAAKAFGSALTASGKSLEYVTAGNSFKVWKEVGGTRILKADGSDNWAKKLNATGKGFSTADFTSYTSILGRVCPPNVYIDDSNKFSTGNCLYYTSESSQTLSANGLDGINGLQDYASPKWYIGNVQACSTKGMRLPTAFETSTNNTAYSFYPSTDGSPVFAQSRGVPAAENTWTATSGTINNEVYILWSGTTTDRSNYTFSYPVRCVLP